MKYRIAVLVGSRALATPCSRTGTSRVVCWSWDSSLSWTVCTRPRHINHITRNNHTLQRPIKKKDGPRTCFNQDLVHPKRPTPSDGSQTRCNMDNSITDQSIIHEATVHPPKRSQVVSNHKNEECFITDASDNDDESLDPY